MDVLNNNNKKIFVLGAGRGQIPIMNLCHKYGAEVYAVGPRGDYPGFEVADHCLYIDVKDKDRVLEEAKRIGIDAIVTDQLDVAVYTASYVAQNLGLQGIGEEVALKFTDKFVMRECASEIGINVPEHFISDSCERAIDLIKEKGVSFPLIMKPCDSDASRGVYKLNDNEDLVKRFASSKAFSKSGKVIIERFIKGEEYVVEAFTDNYKTTNLAVGKRKYFDVGEGKFIPSSTVFKDADSVDSEIEIRLKNENLKLVKGFGLKFGITHGEFLYDKNADKIYLVEIASRGGGVFISSHLVEACCGVNINDRLIRCVLGIERDEIKQLKKGVSAYFCFLMPEGEIKKIEGEEEIRKTDGVIDVFLDNFKVGDVCKPITDKSSRRGPILIKADNVADCISVFEKVKEKLKITIDDGKSVKGIIW